MADSRIQDLPAIDALADGDLFPVARESDSYNARKVTAGQMTDYIADIAQPYLTGAQEAAASADAASKTAVEAVGQIGTAVEDTQAAQKAAEAARDEAVSAGDGIDEKVTRAETAAQTATEKAGQAATSESNAALSAGSAESAKQAAETAKQAAESAQGAAEAASGTATSSATQAARSAQNAQQSEQAAQTAKEGAEAAQEAIENLGVDATTLESGRPATVQKTVENGVVKLTFGLPSGDKGEKGDTGASMERIEKVEGTGAPGTYDTYNVVLTDGQVVGQFQVYNGADGMGAGDMLKAVYDPTGKNTDVFSYVDQAVQDIPVPDVSAQIAQHNADVSAHPDIRAKLAGKEQAGAAADVQSNLDTHVENKQNPHATTAEQVGARPNTWTPTAQEVGADPEGSAAQALTDAKAYTDEKLGNIPTDSDLLIVTIQTNSNYENPELIGVTKDEIASAISSGKQITVRIVLTDALETEYFLPVRYTSDYGDGAEKVISFFAYSYDVGLIASVSYVGEETTVSVSPDMQDARHISYNKKTSGLSSDTVQDAIDELAGEEITAKNVSYDNSTSGMTATDVQAAISELSAALAGGGGVKFESGSYVGTGTRGANNPVTINFSGNAQMVFVFGVTFIYVSLSYPMFSGFETVRVENSSGNMYTMTYNLKGSVLEFYSEDNDPNYQFNKKGETYGYAAILE